MLSLLFLRKVYQLLIKIKSKKHKQKTNRAERKHKQRERERKREYCDSSFREEEEGEIMLDIQDSSAYFIFPIFILRSDHTLHFLHR